MIAPYDGPVCEAGWDDERKAVFVRSTSNGLIDAANVEGETYPSGPAQDIASHEKAGADCPGKIYSHQ